jgi:hypothetical protein
MKDAPRVRRTINTSGPDGDSRKSTTVAAERGALTQAPFECRMSADGHF